MSAASEHRLAVFLKGSLIDLAPLDSAHREHLWQAAQDPEIWTWTSHIADSREDFDGWFDAALAATESGERGVLVILDNSQGSPLGSTSFHSFYPQDLVLEIGATWLTPKVWGSGANVEAKLLMLEHAFLRLRCVRVEFKTDARNKRSRQAIAALPAQFEGVLRKQKTLPGVGTRDSATYSIIDDEWPSVRENLTRRLRRGEQRQSDR